MPRRGAFALALAVMAASAVTVHAQGWPNSPPQSGWPAQPAPQQPPQAPQQAPWPGGGGGAAQQPAPAQAGWPAPAQPGGFGGGGGPPSGGFGGGGGPPGMGGGMGGGGPTPEQLACMKSFTEYREDTEKRGLAAKAAGERKQKPSREEFCKLVTAYADSEGRWMKFTAENLAKCGIPKQILEQIKIAHTHTTEAKTKICSAGPGPAGAAPTLSDALGTSNVPSQETEKRKSGGGTMDTLTGNALAR